MDQRRLEASIDLAAQTADMGFDDVRARIEMNVPDVLEEHRACDHLTSVAHQILEQAEFSRLQLDQFPISPYRARQEIKFQIKHAQFGLCRGRARPSP